MNQTRGAGHPISLCRRCLGFVLGSAVIIVIWCGLLPWIAAQGPMIERHEFLREKGIDPSAMFYTELDAMDEILRRSFRRGRDGSRAQDVDRNQPRLSQVRPAASR